MAFDLSFLNGSNGFVIEEKESGDLLGFSVSLLGDINGDGIDDLIVGDPEQTERYIRDNPFFKGEAYVIFGKEEFAANVEVSELNGSDGFRIEGLNSGDRLGFSVSDGGDVNGDGIDDFIIGAPGYGETIEGSYGQRISNERGISYVVFGNDSGFDSSLDLAQLDGSNGFAVVGVNGGNSTNSAMADRIGNGISSIGDFNGDGIDDLIVNNYIVFGRDEFAPSIEITEFDSSNSLTITNSDRSIAWEFRVSDAGDVNGDGLADVIIGVPYSDPIPSTGYYNTDEGTSYLIFGSTEGDLDGELNLADLDGSNGFAINGTDVSNFPEQSGFSVSSAGDINGDGFDELIIGAYYIGPNTRGFNTTYIVFGSDREFAPSLNLSTLDGSNGFTAERIGGYSVSNGGDINGDGLDDLILGVPNLHPLSSGVSILFGQTAEFSPTITAEDFNGDRGLIVSGDYSSFESASISGGGDINGDGLSDLIIGAPKSARSYVIFGQSEGFAPQLDLDRFNPSQDFNTFFSGSPVKIFGNEREIFGIYLEISDPDSSFLSGAEVAINNQLDGDAEILTADTSDTNITANHDPQTGILNLTGADSIAKYEQVLQTITYNNTAEFANSTPRIIEVFVRDNTDGGESPNQSNTAITTLNFLDELSFSELDESSGSVINALDLNDAFGYPVSSTGDFNGDGIDDVLIGADYAANGAGQSYLIFGSETGLGAEFDLASLDGTNGLVLTGILGDRSGRSLSDLGDINGDGFDDIIIGVPFRNEQNGKSYVVFGSDSGFDAELDLSTLDGDNGFALVNLDNYLGEAVSGAGDINGDGFDDIVVGSSSKRGVIFGSDSGFDAEFDLSTLDGSNGFTIADPNSSYFYDYASDAADINGDGIDDLIISSFRESAVIFGSESGFDEELDLSTLDGANGFTFENPERNSDFTPREISNLNDINGDGVDDIILSLYEFSYVVFGSTTEFDATFDLASLDGTNGFAIENPFPISDDPSVSEAGDINGDGIDDLIFNEFVIFGSNKGFAPMINTEEIDRGLILNGFDSSSVSDAGDINGDGIDDLLIGAFGEDRSYVVYGNDTPLLDLNGSDTGIDFNTNFAGETIAVVGENLILEDTNTPNLVNATIRIANLLDGDAEILAVNTDNTSIIAEYNPTTGILSLTGSDTVANYQKVLQTVTYNNSLENPNTNTRTIEFAIDDGEAHSNRSEIVTTTLGLFNENPTVENSIDNQTIDRQEEFNLTLADDTFIDEDGDELTITATLTNGDALPPWLDFNPDTATFSGTPTDENNGELAILVTADDGNGGIIQETFELTVDIFEPATITHTEDDRFSLSGTPETVTLEFNLVESNTIYHNEIAVFTVDDPNGRIEGIAPDETGYLEAAIARAEVIFSPLPNNTFPDFASSRYLNLETKTDLGFILVSNSTIETISTELAAGNNPENVFVSNTFSLGEEFDRLQVSSTEDVMTLAWEDLIDGGDEDFNDLVMSVTVTDSDSPLGSNLQGKAERELIDLRDISDFIDAEIQIFGDTIYENSGGFYVVENPQGEIRDPLTGELVRPEDAEYATLAIENSLDLDLDLNTGTVTTQLPGNVILAPYLIADGTKEEFLANDSDNQIEMTPQAYFVYSSANPNGIDRVRLLGDNQFGFEDLLDGGDFDYNDFVMQINFQSS